MRFGRTSGTGLKRHMFSFALTETLQSKKTQNTTQDMPQNLMWEIKNKLQRPNSHRAIQTDNSDKLKVLMGPLTEHERVFQWSSLICVLIASNGVSHLPSWNLLSRAQLVIIQTFIGKTISLWKLHWYSCSVNLLRVQTCGPWLDCDNSALCSWSSALWFETE